MARNYVAKALYEKFRERTITPKDRNLVGGKLDRDELQRLQDEFGDDDEPSDHSS